ncbi:MAG: isochorismatase family protein [Isosphaeraceae bacterium]
MLSGPLVFVDVDTQRDFMEPSGALYVPGADSIVSNLKRLTDFARSRRIPILATACAHTPDEPDPEPFPPHCLIGTKGQQRIAATAWTGSGGQVLGLDQVNDLEALPPHLTLHKNRYDVFTHKSADAVIARYGAINPRFVVYGVATDYCVKAAIDGLLDRGQKVALVTDAIKAIDGSAEEGLLAGWAERGVSLVRTDAVVG